MTGTAPLPLRLQIGARTVAAVQRRLVRVPLSLDAVLEGRLPMLPPLDDDAHGYLVTSLPAERCDAMTFAADGLIAHVRQRYTRHHVDLTIGFDAYQAALSGNTRSGLKRKARRVMAASSATLDIRRFRDPGELAVFHGIARDISRRTYQERLFGGGLPEDAAFLDRMDRLAAADAARGWLLYVAGEPAAYLYCPIAAGVVLYDEVGHDPAFSDLSPGSVLMIEALRDLFAEGTLRRFDFTTGDGQHKRGFATHGAPCLDLLLLRASLPNRATTLALGGFDRGVALGKRAVTAAGLARAARRLRR